MSSKPNSARCAVCQQQFRIDNLFPVAMVRRVVAERIEAAVTNWDEQSLICREDLARFRTEYVQSLLLSESRELTDLEEEVIESLHQHDVLASNPVGEFERKQLFGDRLSDRVAFFGGSWKFIILFGVVIAIWMIINGFLQQPFDIYPYILLNLLLSCIAALQAPIIMMSQNRQEIKDRLRSEGDYQVNLKAELEIRHLHEKMDHLLSSQWRRLTEIQQVQIELLNEVVARR